jgi:hypothetical protein
MNKKDTNAWINYKKNANKELYGIKKTIQDKKEEFNKDT